MTTSQSTGPMGRGTLHPGRSSETERPASVDAPAGGRALLLPAALSLVIASFALITRRAVLQGTFVGAALVLLAWTTAVWWSARRSHRALSMVFAPRRTHWVQASAQGTLILYWAAHTPLVASVLPFIVVQLVFAYAVDSLLNWSRREVYSFGFAPFPVIFSINLFLLFRPEFFYWQFVLIALGFAAKELIKWERDGRPAHIFNPSSFPLAVFSVVLLATSSTNMTYGIAIANTIFDTPHIHLVIFLVALPGQILFGVAPVTIAAALTLYGIGLAYLATTGTYLMYDAYIPPAVLIGMTLLATDPSTSPKTKLGKLAFGALYGAGTAILFVLLERAGAPTFYDKLLPVPLLNLMVRFIDRLAREPQGKLLDLMHWKDKFTPRRTNVAYASVWAAAFLSMLAMRAVGDTHPGQYLPFWHNACAANSTRACRYVGSLTAVYCERGSGWACNDVGILKRRIGAPADADFRRACALGYPAGCENSNNPTGQASALAGGPPAVRDLPIVLSGTRPTLRERDPAKLYALACEQGWPGACAKQ